MIRLVYIILTGIILLSATTGAPNDHTVEEINAIHKSIDELQENIQNNLSKKDSVLYKKIDYLQDQLPTLSLQEGRLALYLKSIEQFLVQADPKSEDWSAKEEFLFFLPGMADYETKKKATEYFNSQIGRSLDYANYIGEHPTYQEFLNQLSRQDPDTVITMFKKWQGEPHAIEMVEHMAYHAPFRFKKFLHYRNAVRAVVDVSSDPVVQKVWEVFDQYRFSAKSFYFVDDIMNNRAQVDDLELKLKEESFLNASIWNLNQRDGIMGYHSIQSKLKEMATVQARDWNRTFSATSIRSKEWDEIVPTIIYGHEKLYDVNLTSWVYDIPNKGKMPLQPLQRILQSDLSAFLQKLIELELMETFQAGLEPAAQAYVSQQYPGIKNEYISRYRSYYYPVLKPKVVIPEPVVRKSKVPEPIPLIEVFVDDYRKNEIKYRNNVGVALNDMPALIEDVYAYEKLLYAAEAEPIKVLNAYQSYIDQYYVMELLELTAKQAPMTVKKFLGRNDHIIYELLETSSDPAIQTLFTIKDELGPYTRAYFLLDDIYNGTLTPKQADAITKDESKLFKHLAGIASRKNGLGKASANQELKALGIQVINKLNQKEKAGIQSQMDFLSSFSDKQLYQLLILGEGEFYNSTFQAIFSSFISRMNPSNAYAFMESTGFEHVHAFIKMCAEHNTLDRFLNTCKKKDKERLLKQLVSDLEDKGDDLNQIVYVADALVHIRDSRTLKVVMNEIQSGFERSALNDNQEGISIYGLLAGMHHSKAQKNKSWFNYKSHQFIIPQVNVVSNWDLFNYNDENIQQHFFYNDYDGQSSYNNFLRVYKQSPEWIINDRGSYVIIESVQGKKVKIFANKPSFEVEGQQTIVDYFATHSLEPKVVVHRGLSSHQHKTMQRMPHSAVIINDGSCGGYQNMQAALDRCPNAQVISTRKIGTMHVNDPMFKMLNDDIRLGKDIHWGDFWQRASAKLGSNPHFADYVPPNQNVGAKFIQAYNLVMGL